MTTKEKYELFDKTKINEKVLGILKNMQESSKNFTDESVNSKIDSALDKLIENFRANKPEALLTLPEAKKEVKKEKEKAIKKNEGKDLSDKKDTDDKTGLPKKDNLEERKDIIKKESETEKEARDRAKKELEKEKEKAKDEIESQIEKLNRLIQEDPALQGFNTGSAATGGGRSTPIIDAERKALPRGSRVSQKGWQNQYGASKGGRKYWENRENRSDRKSPEYETGKPYLEKGGNIDSLDERMNFAIAYNYAKDRGVDSDKSFEEFKEEFRRKTPKSAKYSDKVMKATYYALQQNYAKGGMVVTSIKDIPNFEQRNKEGKITYRGLGLGKLFDDFYDLAGENGARIKVDGKEYFITDTELNTFLRDADGKIRIRFDAPYRKGELGGMMADGGMVNRKELNKKIKDWYITTYPTDKEGKEINDKITFKGFWAYLSQGYDVYDVLEVADSLIRERVFGKLSEIYAVDYDVVYNMWLRSEKYDKGGQMADGGKMKSNNIDAELKDFNLDDLDEFENMQFNQYYPSLGKVGALQVLINNVEGDYSQLSTELSELAEKQISNEEWDKESMRRYGYAEGGMMAKGGDIQNTTFVVKNLDGKIVLKTKSLNKASDYQGLVGRDTHTVETLDGRILSASGGEMENGSRNKYDVVYNSYDQETGEEIAKGESVFVMANSSSEAKNKALTMLEEGSSDEEFTIVRANIMMAKGGYMADGGKVLKKGYFAYPSGDEGDELGVFKDKETMIKFAIENKDKYGKLIFEGIENGDILEVKKGDSKDVITWVFSRIGMDTKEANKKIKMWFISNYPADEEEAKQIDESVTFDDIWFDLKNQRGIYDRLGNPYVVREVFEKIASIYGVEYDFVEKIYKRESYAKGGFMADGGMMAKGGGVPYKPYGKTKGRFKLTYEVEGEPQSEIRESLEEAMNSAKRYCSPKLGYTDVHIYDESGKEYFFADGGEVEFDMEDDAPDYNSISDLEEEYRRLVRWSNQYGSKGADAKIEQLKKRIEYLKSHSMARGGYMADGENYEYVNTFKRFDSDVPVPEEDFKKLVDAYHKQLSGDKLAVVKYNVLKVQMGNYLGHKTVEEMEEYIQKTHEAHKMAHGGYMEHRGTITDDSLESILKSDFPKSNYQLHHDNISGHKIYGQKDVIKTIQKHLLTEYGIKSEYDKEGFGLPFLRVYSQFVDKYAQGGYMADGGEVDFSKKMAKMRSAYENLDMIVKSKIAMAIGIDEAIRIMENDYSIDPFSLISSAVRGGLLELDEINKDLVNEAVYEAERVTDDYRDSGQGIGGSDMTYFTKNVLDSAGYKTGFLNNRLSRVDADGNELVIDKYEMNY